MLHAIRRRAYTAEDADVALQLLDRVVERAAGGFRVRHLLFQRPDVALLLGCAAVLRHELALRGLVLARQLVDGLLQVGDSLHLLLVARAEVFLVAPELDLQGAALLRGLLRQLLTRCQQALLARDVRLQRLQPRGRALQFLLAHVLLLAELRARLRELVHELLDVGLQRAPRLPVDLQLGRGGHQLQPEVLHVSDELRLRPLRDFGNLARLGELHLQTLGALGRRGLSARLLAQLCARQSELRLEALVVRRQRGAGPLQLIELRAHGRELRLQLIGALHGGGLRAGFFAELRTHGTKLHLQGLVVCR
mmetsp:Transcript_33768/g.86517  ORF Transcript_33768/g.86517 Transcript_33768/m.86517 type:complete len:308 (-) Transcript_33768:1834-2757(-)